MRTLLILLLSVSPAWALDLGVYPCCGHPAQAGADLDATTKALISVGATLGYIGDFIDPESPGVFPNLSASLESVWQRGAVPVVNLMTSRPLQPFARPASAADWALANLYYPLAWTINAWAAKGGGRHLYLLPYPEHNGNWVAYGETPDDFIRAVGRLRYVLWWTGALTHIRMVWGPNVGRNLAPYYQAWQWDLVGGSIYGGGCAGLTAPPEAVEGFVNTLTALAPGKPVLIAQTGVGSGDRIQWGQEVLQRLSRDPRVRGVVWFDRHDQSSGCQLGYTPEEWQQVLAPFDWRVSQ